MDSFERQPPEEAAQIEGSDGPPNVGQAPPEFDEPVSATISFDAGQWRPIPSADTEDRISDRYELLDNIGSGGMGEVYRARHVSLGTECAVKILRDRGGEGSTTRISRFEREAKLLASMQHPNIVRVSDFGKLDDGRPYMAMELIRGRDLREWIDEDPHMPWTWIRALMLQMLDGLGAAHEHGIVHRDIKPSNCLILDTADSNIAPQLRLIDFGIARLVNITETASELTGTGAVIGTAKYMSPEQASGRPVDTRTDIYSAGIVLYELIAGAPPFDGRTHFAVAAAHMNEDPPPLPALEGLSAEENRGLHAIVQRALHKLPEDRFSTTAEFAHSLHNLSRQRTYGQISGREPGRVLPSTRHQQAQTDDLHGLAMLGRYVRSSWLKPRILASKGKPNQEFLPLQRSLHYAFVEPHEGRIGVQHSSQSVDHVAGETTAAKIFKNHARSLLITGPAGGGKSTQLLDLCESLLTSDERSVDGDRVIPAVFSLTNWGARPISLFHWLVRELAATYQTPVALARKWLSNGHIVPLLDGLDTLPTQKVGPCIDAINHFMEEHGTHGIAVVCRTDAYLLAARTLRVRVELRLEGVLFKSVEDNEPETAKRLAAVLGLEPGAVAAIPPLLVTVARDDALLPAAQSSDDGSAQTLLDGYLSAIAARWDSRRKGKGVPARSLVEFSQRIARALHRHQASMFIPDDIQPALIHDAPLRLLYFVTTRAAAAALLLSSFYLALLHSPLDNQGFVMSHAYLLRVVLTGSGVIAVLHGALAIVRVKRSKKGTGLMARWKVRLVNVGGAGVVAAAVGPLCSQDGHPMSVAIAAEVAFLTSFLLLSRSHSDSLHRDIRFPDRLRWSWKNVRAKWWMIGLAVLIPGSLSARAGGPVAGLVLSISLAATCLAYVGLVASQAEDTLPQSAMRRSGRYALRFGLGFGLFALLLFSLPYGFVYGSFVALTVGFVAAMWFGGTQVLHHWALRAILRIEGTLPLRLQSMLDTSTSAGLLHRVGTGYVLPHRGLRSLLATIEPGNSRIQGTP
ncbi:MAG: protein kinase [Nannocystaceae bacterium]